MGVTSALMVATWTSYSVSQVTKSTYFCFDLIESQRTTLFLQVTGLMLDAGIVILLWRMLAWSRTMKLRLRALGSVLVLSALSMSFVWVGSSLYGNHRVLHAGFGFLYGFDIVVDSIAFAALMISTAFWVCETSPLAPATIITFLVGTFRTSTNVFSYGDWLHLSRSSGLVPLWFISIGMVWFTYCHELRSVVFIRRAFLAILLLALLIGATVFTFVKQPPTFEKRHPINDMIYVAHVKHDQWLRQMTISTNPETAVKVYKERHGGRDPPPHYGDWYTYAQGTVIRDQFDQIDRDLRPFWELSPEMLRSRASTMAMLFEMITIKDGQAQWSGLTRDNEAEAKKMDTLVAMINKFAKSLPDMILPINLSPTPRILPSWEEANRKSYARVSAVTDLINKRALESADETTEAVSVLDESKKSISFDSSWRYTSAVEYRRMQVEACPPGSRMRTNPHWKFGEFCSACIRPHSKGQLLTNWEKSLQYCSQPDLKYLHGMSLTNPQMPPIPELYPLFGSSKTEAFRDIMIPFPGDPDEKPDMRWEFKRRYDNLFWRGDVGEHALSNEALHGSHKLRLLHLVNNPNPGEQVTMVLPKPGSPDKFGYEKVSIIEANKVVPFSLGINNYSACLGQNCDLVKEAYGTKDELQEPLEYRYVLLLDEDDRPPTEMMRTLKSGSVPFVSTIFQTWYTERLMPWMHFVPIDPRYQALHTIYTYFTGTQNRGKINGRETDMKARQKDAEWIGQQGQKWAEKALGERDMEAYLYRLLLEWGRLLDERRDSIGFRVNDKGEFESDEWTKAQ
ncbi:Fc.00g004700.m01.CDS01 [Cosmosporella sp. VM-42]